HRRTPETWGTRAGCAPRESDDARARLARVKGRVAAAREAETAHESTSRGIRDALENAQAQETALVTQITACRVEVGSIGERVEALGRELVRADQMEADLTQRLEQGKTRQQQLGERRVWLEEERQR